MLSGIAHCVGAMVLTGGSRMNGFNARGWFGWPSFVLSVVGALSLLTTIISQGPSWVMYLSLGLILAGLAGLMAPSEGS